MTASATIVCADLIRPSRRMHALAYDAALVIAGSALIALSAHLKVYLPFSPVPVTGQTFAVLFLGALLGSKRGSLAVAAYIMEGIAGIPVFAGGASAAYLRGPTGGYLAGFLAGAYLTGWFSERGFDRSWLGSVIAIALGEVLVFGFGVAWLSHFIGAKAIAAGFVPFIPGEIVKIAIASSLLPAGWKLLRKK